MDYGRNNGRMGKAKFSMANIAGDPFSLATSGIAIAGWLVAFIGSIISVKAHGHYPNYTWWSLVYMLFVVIGVMTAVACDCVYQYQVAIVGLLSAGLVFTTSSVNSLIYGSDSAREAAAAGFILLSIVAVVWIVYYGAAPNTPHRQTIDSFALHKEGATNRASRHMTQSYRPDTMVSTSQQPQMYNSAQLAGFETSTPVTGFTGTSTAREGNAFQQQAAAQQSQLQAQPSVSTMGLGAANEAKPNTTAEYPYRAKAIYSYEANPDDANEISFAKHEVLDVSDVSGRWWQAKKENGETGIAPSNYLILL